MYIRRFAAHEIVSTLRRRVGRKARRKVPACGGWKGGTFNFGSVCLQMLHQQAHKTIRPCGDIGVEELKNIWVPRWLIPGVAALSGGGRERLEGTVSPLGVDERVQVLVLQLCSGCGTLVRCNDWSRKIVKRHCWVTTP